MFAINSPAVYPFPPSIECTMTLISRLDEEGLRASVHDAIDWLEEHSPHWSALPGFREVQGVDISAYPYRNGDRIYVPFGICRAWNRRVEAKV